MSTYDTNPRDYALKLVELGAVTSEHLLLCALKWMSHDDVRDMLEVNELSPMRLQESDSDLQDE